MPENNEDWDETAFSDLIIFFRYLANYRYVDTDSMLTHRFYGLQNFVSKYFRNALIEFVQTLPQPRQLREVQSPLSDFWKKSFNSEKLIGK